VTAPRIIAPRLRVADLPVPDVPSSKVTCSRCGAECWSSNSASMPGLTVDYICMPCFKAKIGIP
jgi:formylmethanofuran dehydrogenase subunit E